MLKNTKLVTVASVAAIAAASQAWAATTHFTLDEALSSLNVRVTVEDGPTGNDTAPVKGSLSADIGATGYSLTSIHVDGMNLETARGLSIPLDFGFLGGALIRTTPLNLTMVSPGSAATIRPDGSFAQSNNTMASTGSLEYSFSGIMGFGLEPGSQSLDTQGTTSLEGNIIDTGISGSGHSLQLIIPVTMRQVQTIEDYNVTVDITGYVVSNGVYTAVPEAASLAILAGAPLLMCRRRR